MIENARHHAMAHEKAAVRAGPYFLSVWGGLLINCPSGQPMID